MCEERTTPPEGIHLDYEEILSTGTHGPIDAAAALRILLTEVEDANTRGDECLEKSREHLSHDEGFADFALATAALREVTRVYPIHRSNWHSGERIPLGHAWEVAWESVLLSYRGHYKAAYQRLREVLEMVVLQQFFYISQDESMVRSWGRAEMRTPSFRKMLRACANDARCSSVATALHLEESIGSLYDLLGAYVHTRGLPSTTMGLGGSNTIRFSVPALERFCSFFVGITHAATVLLASYFPAAIIPMYAFKKMGHLDPGWLPREDHVNSIRLVLAQDEIELLERNAEGNAWFSEVARRLAELPDLTPEQEENTYQELQEAVRKGPREAQRVLKRANALLVPVDGP
jgi:hypothetical protein